MKSITKKLIASALLTGIVLSTSAGTGMVQAESIHTYSEQQQATKYPKKVMEAVRESLGVDKHSTEIDTRIAAIPQVEVMDTYLESFGKKIKGNEVREAVRGVFNIDLDDVSKNITEIS